MNQIIILQIANPILIYPQHLYIFKKSDTLGKPPLQKKEVEDTKCQYGYRIIDAAILSHVISILLCLECEC